MILISKAKPVACLWSTTEKSTRLHPFPYVFLAFNDNLPSQDGLEFVAVESEVCFKEQWLMRSCVKLLIYSMYPVKLRKQDNQICSGLLWNTRGSCLQRGRRERGATQETDQEVCSSATDRTIYGNRCRDLIGQPEWRLEVLIGWEPHGGSHARTHARTHK